MSSRVERAIRDLVGQPRGAQWSIYVLDSEGKNLGAADPDTVLSTASIGKVLLLTEIARGFDDQSISRDEVLTRSENVAVGDSGLWQHLDSASLSIADAAVLVASVSDNLATNVLLERVGLPAVQRTGSVVGLHRTNLLDRVRDRRGAGDVARLSEGTSRELAQFMLDVGCGTLLSPSVSMQLRHWLSLNADLSMVAEAFRLDPLAHDAEDRGYLLINKTGTDAGVRADVGFVQGPGGAVAYAVIANWDQTSDERDRVLDGMAAIGAAIRVCIS